MIISEDKDGIADLVIDKLKSIYDPEIPVDIYELGLVYEYAGKGDGVIKIVMTLTAPGCPVASEIIQNVEQTLMQIEGVNEVRVELTFDPPWDKSMMSEEAKLELGFL